MTVFVVLGTTPTTPLDQAVQGAFPNESKKLGTGQWLVSASGITTQDVTEKLGAASGEKGKVFVASIQNFWGWHQTDVWEWIQAKVAS